MTSNGEIPGHQHHESQDRESQDHAMGAFDPSARTRGLLGVGSVLFALLIALADLASAWVIVALPVTVVAMTAYNYMIISLLGCVRTIEDRPDTA